MRRIVSLMMVSVVALAMSVSQPMTAADKPTDADKESIERTRVVVKLVDDINKSCVVHTTDTYVKAQDQVPAARVAAKVFKDLKDKGWITDGRLIDVSGKPANDQNVAKTDFEKAAAKVIKGGKAYYEELGTSKDGKKVLRAATLVPCVMKACINCHDGFKIGDPLGALIYEVPLIK